MIKKKLLFLRYFLCILKAYNMWFVGQILLKQKRNKNDKWDNAPGRPAGPPLYQSC